MVFEKVRPATGSAVEGSSGPPRPRRAVTLVLVIGSGALFGTALVALLTGATAFNVVPATTSQWRPAVTAVLLVAFAGALLLHLDLRPAGARTAFRSIRARRIAWWSFVAVCFAAQLVLAHAVLQLPTWDAAQIFEVAYHMAVAPQPRLFSEGDQSAYFRLYPNNLFLVAVFAGLFGVLRLAGLSGIEQFLWATVVVNCLALTASLVLIRVVARRLATGASTAISVALALLLVVLSPWLNVAYSDTLAMVFPIGMLALWLVWPHQQSVRSTALLFTLLGVVAAAGMAVKPPVVFMALALLLATVTRSGGPRLLTRERIVPAVALVAALGLSHAAVGSAVHALVPQFGTDAGMPFAHYLAMGATGDGGFNPDDFNRTFALPEAVRSTAALHLWADRVQQMGPLGYPLFLAEKMLYALSDGSFFQDREGVGPYDRSFFSTDAFSASVQAVFPLGAPLHFLLSSLWQAAWWSAVLLCFVPLRRLPSLQSLRPGAVLAMRAALLLLLAFLCLSESRSRYLYHYLPVVLVLAGLGGAALRAEVALLRRRVRPVSTR